MRRRLRNWQRVWLYDLLSHFRVGKVGKGRRIGPIITLDNALKLRLPRDQIEGSKTIVENSSSYLSDIKRFFAAFAVHDGDNIIDIGAHVGTFSVEIFRRSREIMLFCYEPDRQNFDALSENLRLNHIPLGRYILHNKAVYSKNSPMAFAKGMSSTTGSIQEVGVYKINNGSRRYFAQNEVVDNQCVSCDAVTLNDIFLQNGIEQCKLLKVDCEGSEYEIFYSTPSNVLEHIDFMIIEVHPTDSHKPIELKSFLCDVGFEVHEVPFSNGCGMFYCRNAMREIAAS